MRCASLLITTACLLVLGAVCVSQAKAQLVGLWEFENSGDLNAATIGADVTTTLTTGGNTGTVTAVSGSGGTDTGAAEVTKGAFFSSADTWYRAVLSVDVGNAISLYIDGTQINGHNVDTLDGRFALEPILHLIGDNDGDDATVAALGSAGAPIPEPSTIALIAMFGLGLSAAGLRKRWE